MIQRFVMISVFSSILFFLSYYPIARVFEYFSLTNAWLATLLSVLILPLGLLIASITQNKFLAYLGKVTNGFFASLLLFISITYIVELLRVFVLIADAFAGMLIVAVTLVGIVISIMYARSWRVKKIVITSPKIKKEVQFVQLSDVHAFGALAAKNIKSVFDRATKLNPDFIVVTGDLVDMPGRPHLDTFKILDDIKVPIFYEFGNHEVYVGLDHVRDMVKRSKLKLLEDTATTIKGVTLISISDSVDKKYVEKTLPTIKRKTSNFQVLLYHKPIEYVAAQENGVDLMLSGHTHAGQFFPVHFIVKLMYKYPWGTHKIKNMTLHTSPGSGTFTWPLRLFSMNQVTHITLKPSK